MSIFIIEVEETANICAMHPLVKCDGLRDDSRNCPYWKGI